MIKKGFTLIELSIVIIIIGILVLLGGISYNRMKIRAQSVEAKNHADNISRIISNMYKTGIYGHDKKYGFKGAYPSVETMIRESPNGQRFSESIKNTYDKDQNIKFIVADSDYDVNRDPRKLIGGLSQSATNDQVQEYLRKNHNLIIYQPLFSNSSSSVNKTRQLCRNRVGVDAANCGQDDGMFDEVCGYDDCREAVVYYVTNEDGVYKLAESNKLRAGIEEK